MKCSDSRLPHFEALVGVLGEFTVGSATLEQVLGKIESFEAQLLRMESHYRSELEYWAYVEALHPIAEEVETNFCLLQVQLGDLRECLIGDLTELPQWTEFLAATQTRLLKNFEATSAVLSSEESYSDSPYINELIRVAYAVLEEKLPLEALQSRLTAYSEIFRASGTALSEYPSVQVLEAIEILESGLVLVEEFLLDPTLEESLEEGLAGLEEGAYLLGQAQAQIEAEENRRQRRVCHRCSADNEATHKTCAVCGTTLWSIVDGTQSRFDIRVHQTGVSSVAPTYSEQVERILSGVDRVLRGELASPELIRQISTFNRGLHSLGMQFQRLTVNQEVLLELCESMQSELSRCAEGLKVIRAVLSSGTTPELQQARDTFEDSVLNLGSLQTDYRNFMGEQS